MNDVHNPALPVSFEMEEIPGRDLFSVAQFLVPTDAHLARGCLVAAGIPAVVADDQHGQTHSLMTMAMGGVRVMVPLSYMDEAREVLAARDRGEFAIDDDADVGDPE